MKNTIIVMLKNGDSVIDVEVPKSITANELILGLNQGLGLGINVNDSRQCYLCSKNPRALIKGNKTLEDFGLRDGTMLIYQGGE